MIRPLRIEFDSVWSHGMNLGAGRRRVLESTARGATFLALRGKIPIVDGIEVHTCCLMGDHHDPLLRTPRAGLAHARRHLDGIYAQRLNCSMRTDGPMPAGDTTPNRPEPVLEHRR